MQGKRFQREPEVVRPTMTKAPGNVFFCSSHRDPRLTVLQVHAQFLPKTCAHY